MLGVNTPMHNEKIYGLQENKPVKPVESKTPKVETGTKPSWAAIYSQQGDTVKKIGEVLTNKAPAETGGKPAFLVSGAKVAKETHVRKPEVFKSPEQDTQKQVADLASKLGGDEGALLDRLFYNKKFRKAVGIDDVQFRSVVASAAKGEEWGQKKLGEIVGAFVPQDLDSATLERMAQVASARGDMKEFARLVGLMSKAKEGELAAQKYKEEPAHKAEVAKAQEPVKEAGEKRAEDAKKRLMEFHATLRDKAPQAARDFENAMDRIEEIAGSGTPEQADNVIAQLLPAADEKIKALAKQHFLDIQGIKAGERGRAEAGAARMNRAALAAEINAIADGPAEAMQEELKALAKESGRPVEQLQAMAAARAKVESAKRAQENEEAGEIRAILAKARSNEPLSKYEQDLYNKHMNIGSQMQVLQGVMGPPKAESEKPKMAPEVHAPAAIVRANEMLAKRGKTPKDLDEEDREILYTDPEEFIRGFLLAEAATKKMQEEDAAQWRAAGGK